MNQRTFLIIAAVLVFALVGFLVFVLTRATGDSVSQSPALPEHRFESWDDPVFDPAERREQALSIFDESIDLSYDLLMEKARKGEVSLVSELWRLRRRCPEDLDRYECNLLLRQYIMETFGSPDNERMAELLTRYLKYEEEMIRFQVPRDASLRDGYRMIREKRRDHFSEDEAQLVFGLEEARVQLSEREKEFMERTRGMSGDQRVEAYKAMRKEVLGDYYDAVVNRESSFDQYNMEVELRDSDLSALESNERSVAMRKMRIEYFGEAAADRMARVDETLAAEEQQLEKLRAAEQKLRANNPELKGDELADKLMELRVSILGKAEAEAYARREQYRQAMERLRNEP